ncbi:putative membrane-bound O-acyltransferase domain-containing protein 2-like [Capsicum annuum]|uniref:protein DETOXIFICATION 49 n=1 Tax=Capsicum annuum TaxID=4072 RepID=UPI0007BEFC2D|nr:protein DETOXIFICATION 49 [Capsicum annuum]KAF3616144.1 putative membrane-bound O-acyltransferase domain-containing protein 2-like [Capsicum annuum]KAF3661171.1 putative membrane-bound O-acyltransferase domain-containing protein 2-like [Capsicum annuum]
MLNPLNPAENDQEQIKTEQNPLFLAILEAKSIANIAFPMIFTGLLLYSRSMISMLFLGRLGELSLAGGSLAIGFANITGYSILSGLAMGMEPLCGQAFGAKRFKILGLSLQRTVILLLLISIPISFLWCNMLKILIFCGQDHDIAIEAQIYILYSMPDLIALAILHPLRIYLRSQSIIMPLTYCATLASVVHIPINYLLVIVLDLGIKGVALSGVWTNFNLVGCLIAYIVVSKVYKKTWSSMSCECFKGWKSLLDLAIPSCVSVCLEWWWYEIMILLCGLLVNPKSTVASMGILIQTTSLIYIFPSSLSFGVSTRVGNELGANRPDIARLVAVVGLTCSFVLGLVALVFAILVRDVWASMFTQDEEIIALTSLILPIIGLCELGNCPQTTGCGVLRGTARPKLGANINLGCFYLVGMPVAVYLGFFCGYDFTGLWIGLLAAQASCAMTMLLVILSRTNWADQAKRAKELTTIIENEDEQVYYRKIDGSSNV